MFLRGYDTLTSEKINKAQPLSGKESFEQWGHLRSSCRGHGWPWLRASPRSRRSWQHRWPAHPWPAFKKTSDDTHTRRLLSCLHGCCSVLVNDTCCRGYHVTYHVTGRPHSTQKNGHYTWSIYWLPFNFPSKAICDRCHVRQNACGGCLQLHILALMRLHKGPCHLPLPLRFSEIIYLVTPKIYVPSRVPGKPLRCWPPWMRPRPAIYPRARSLAGM